jgi:hypothetical protein
MQAGTILFSEMTPPQGREDEFNAWYDTHHIPVRMAVPGFQGAQRYVREGDNYLAVYDMDSEDVLASAAYAQVKNNPDALTQDMLANVSGFSRYICNQIGVQARFDVTDDEALQAPVLYAVFFNVPEGRAVEFDHWYDTDHVPTLLENPGWLMCRRFTITESEPWRVTHLALHYLADEAVLESEEREKARASDWRARLAEEPWFQGKYLVFHKLGARFGPA